MWQSTPYLHQQLTGADLRFLAYLGVPLSLLYSHEAFLSSVWSLHPLGKDGNACSLYPSDTHWPSKTMHMACTPALHGV